MIKGVHCTFKSGMEGANLWPGKWILHFDNADSPTKHFHENDFWSKKKTPTPFMLMFPKLNHIIDKVMLQTIWEQHRPYVHNIISSQVPGCGTDNAKYVQTEGNYQNSPKFGNNTYSYNSQNQSSVRIVCSVKLYKQGTENFSRGHPVLFQCNIKMK